MQSFALRLAGTTAALALLAGLAAAPAMAADSPVNGTYYGKYGAASGNPTGNWTITNGTIPYDTPVLPGGTIELGLRASPRYLPGSPAPDTTGPIPVYTFDTGSPWNYNFSIDALTTGYHLSDGVAMLSITGPGGLSNTPFDVLSIPDNNKDGQDAATSAGIANSAATRAQNSENLGFAGVGLPGYNPWVAGTYDIKLTLYSATDTTFSTPLATNEIKVNAVPEPASMALLGAGLLGLGLIRRRRA